MPFIEAEFQKMLNDTNFFCDQYYSGLYYSLYKYTMELLFDGYPVPDKYIIVENRVLHQFPKIYYKLAKRGDLSLIQKMLRLDRNSNICIYTNAKYTMAGAAKVGNIGILKWMIQNNYPHYENTISFAAKGNQLETIELLIANNFKINSAAIYHAAGKGNLNIVNFLHQKNCKYASNYLAASNGHFAIIKHLYSLNPNTLGCVCDGAAKSGNLDILKFAYEKGQKISFFGYMHPHILSWLIENNHINANNMPEEIASCNDLKCMQILYENGFNILTKNAFVRAVASQNVEIIKWLHNLGCPFDIFATREAVHQKSLIILKLLVEWGCAVGDDYCLPPAIRGDLEMLQYLHDIGCPLYEDVIAHAASGGHLHIIIWCREQGCKWNSHACARTVYWNHLNVLRWLRGFDRNTCELKSNETEICPWDEKVCLEAIQYNHIDILKFALENTMKFTSDCFDAAMKSKNVDIVTLVESYYPLRIMCE